MFCYCRKLFHASDGGTFALDWLLTADGNNNFYVVHLAVLLLKTSKKKKDVMLIRISSTCKLAQVCTRIRTNIHRELSGRLNFRN